MSKYFGLTYPAAQVKSTQEGRDILEAPNVETQRDLLEVYSRTELNFRIGYFDATNLKKSNAGYIGSPGQAGFGVGVYPHDDLPSLGLSPMYDCNNPYSENHGNYLHTNGSVMVFIPKFFYRIGLPTHELYSKFGDNLVEIVGADEFANETEANANGFILHRAFIDGGVEKSGFFIDKYIASKSPDNANIAISRRFGVPISLTADANYTRSNGMTGCTGILADAVVLSKARGSAYNNASVFMTSALAMISLVHGQFSSSSLYCSWYDPSYTNCFPKGCNNNALGDVNDSTIKYVTAGDTGTSAKPQTGSLDDLSKASHNGQGSGVIDINGCMWEVGLGVTTAGSSATASTDTRSNNLYVLKESTALATLTFDWNTTTSAWGDATNLLTKYDLFVSPVTMTSNDNQKWGNGTNPVFYTNVNGSERAVNGVLALNNSALSVGGINLFGNDLHNRYSRQNMYVRSGGFWSDASNAGAFSRDFSDWRSHSDASRSSFRSACYGL